MMASTGKRLGFFTRLLDAAPPAERYRLAAEQIASAEQHGYDSAWVAQHHFDGDEGGLPAPFVFLSHVAARTTRIRLGTGIVTLPLEAPLRVAEDAAVLDALSGGRLEIGVGSGGTPSSFAAFGQDSASRGAIFGRHLAVLRDAWAGRHLGQTENRLYPTAGGLLDRLWQATFSVEGGRRAGEAGDGLMLSRTQPRLPGTPGASLADLQNPIIDAYLAALPPGRAPRIVGSRSVFVAESRAEARRLADLGLRRSLARFKASGFSPSGDTLDEILATYDVHVGTPEDVAASLRADTALARVTDLAFQVHSVDPPHADILRSIRLITEEVAPALGWQRTLKVVPVQTGPSPDVPPLEGSIGCSETLVSVGAQRSDEAARSSIRPLRSAAGRTTGRCENSVKAGGLVGMEIESTVAAILDAVRSLLLRPEPGDVAFDGERRELLARWPTPSPVTERSEPHRLPVCRFIDDALSAAARGPAHDLAAAMAPLLPALRWSYGYPPRPNEPGLASRIGFAQIIGPRGLMDHHQIHMGLTLMAPGTHYPMHAHPAIETYLVVSGTADWRVERETFAARPPGSFIFHRGGIGHAMWTQREAMLALYCWRGDLVTAPVYIDATDPP